tara:strand:- start:182 stop:367 length:186 start_codon:yes stop_codon:yes gene_type:complete
LPHQKEAPLRRRRIPKPTSPDYLTALLARKNPDLAMLLFRKDTAVEEMPFRIMACFHIDSG